MEWIALVVFVVLFFLFVRFARVDEGTAIALTSFGEFSKIIFRWKNHWMDSEWNIWRVPVVGENPEEGSEGKQSNKSWGQRLFGGLIVYFWPFQKTHRYKHRWTDIRLQQAGMEVEFHEEDLPHVLLRPAVYAFKLTAVETKPPERIPVDVLVLVTLRVRNPYLFLFVAPPTPVEDILARISAETRALVTSCQIDELLQLKGASFWERLREAKVIKETLEKWGMKLADKGIEIRDIDLAPEYQKAAAAKRAKELEALGRAKEIAGTITSSVATVSGREETDVQKEFFEDPSSFYQRHRPIIDNVMTKLAIEGDAYFKSEIVGGSGLSGELISFLGALKKILPELLDRGLAKESAGEATGKTGEEKPVKPKSILSTLASTLPRKLSKEEDARIKEELNQLPEKQKNQWLDWIAWATASGKLKTEK